MVEDEAWVRQALRRMLELEGISVIEAVDGDDAIRVIERDEAQLLDIVLTDLRMPVVSGSELIAVVLECRPALPILAMSAAVDLPPNLRTVPFLRKPFSPDELVRAVAPLVLSSQAVRRLSQQADAADSRSTAEGHRLTARTQMAQNGDLRLALQQLREKLSRH
jgi:two-component system C4-dicarboxylate transport response regulator DctD